jgi:hypothetical protein
MSGDISVGTFGPDDLSSHVPNAHGDCAGCLAVGQRVTHPCALVLLAGFVEATSHEPSGTDHEPNPWERGWLPRQL